MFNPFLDMDKYKTLQRPLTKSTSKEEQETSIMDKDILNEHELEQGLRNAVASSKKPAVSQVKEIKRPTHTLKQVNDVDVFTDELKATFLYQGVFETHFSNIEWFYAKRKIKLKTTLSLTPEYKNWLMYLKDMVLDQSQCQDILTREYMQDNDSVTMVTKSLDISINLFMSYSATGSGDTQRIVLPPPEFRDRIEDYITVSIKDDLKRLSLAIFIDVLINKPCFRI